MHANSIQRIAALARAVLIQTPTIGWPPSFWPNASTSPGPAGYFDA